MRWFSATRNSLLAHEKGGHNKIVFDWPAAGLHETFVAYMKLLFHVFHCDRTRLYEVPARSIMLRPGLRFAFPWIRKTGERNG